ncbi:MAG: DoxX family membrane protein [Limnohabitans sp.]
MEHIVKRYWLMLPDFEWSHVLLRIPLALVFVQQGLNKMPLDFTMAHGLGIPELVWVFVTYGELLSGLGLLAGGVLSLKHVRDNVLMAFIGDALTRFSGIVMCCIVTGVFWTVIKPHSFAEVDMFHLFLWMGGLYFALRGNWVVASINKQS